MVIVQVIEISNVGMEIWKLQTLNSEMMGTILMVMVVAQHAL